MKSFEKNEDYYDLYHLEVTVACNLVSFREGNYCIPESHLQWRLFVMQLKNND